MTRKKTETEPQKDKTGARYYNPPNILRQKVGTGGIEPLRLERAEDFLAKNTIEFRPFARSILEKLDKSIAIARKKDKADRATINTISGPIMEMKASGGMFNYMLVTEIAGVVLNFLENITELNDDGFEIIDVHQKTLEAIIKHNLRGDGGREGRALAQELYDACNRYRKKYQVVVDVE
jgi:hypothetical protein